MHKMERMIEFIIIPIGGLATILIINDWFDGVIDWSCDLQLKSKILGFINNKTRKLLTCAKCMSGQIALWYSIVESFSFYHSFALVTVSIYLAYIIQKGVEKWL